MEDSIRKEVGRRILSILYDVDAALLDNVLDIPICIALVQTIPAKIEF